jgi:alkylation response protein AidB-like acyl-CoA dehydrogenase
LSAYEKEAALPSERADRLFDPAKLQEISSVLAITAADYDRSSRFPHDNFRLLHSHGIIGLQAARELKNDTLTLGEARQVVAAVARGEPSTALILIMTWLFGMQVARNPHWPKTLRRHVLEDIAFNGSLTNALRAEPALGTPVRGGLPDTIARRVEGGWLISGHKLYSTGIAGLNWLGVWGRTDDVEPLVGMFLVPGNAPGIRIVETWDQLGMRATGSHDAIFENVFIPAEYAVDIRVPKSWAADHDSSQVAWMMVLLSTLYDAVARNARDWLANFVTTRVPSNLGAPLSTLPRFEEALGKLDALLFISEALLDRAVATNGVIPPTESSLIKHIVTNNAIKVTELSISLVGNPALSRNNPLERHHRDALCGRIHSPQDDTILSNTGRFAFAAIAT